MQAWQSHFLIKLQISGDCFCFSPSFFSKIVTSRSCGYICFAYINIFKVYAVFGAFASIPLKITFWKVWVNISFLDIICLYTQWVLTQLEWVEKQILPLSDTEICYEIATGIILVVRTQNFLKITHVLPPDTHTYLKKSEFLGIFCKRSHWMISFYHCVKSIRIQSFSDLYFPAFGLNTDNTD